MATKQKKKRCVYCHSSEDLTRDHIPPKSLFPKPRPIDLITVNCCRECHQEFTEDDQYFRNYLIFSRQCRWHAAARQLQEIGLRSLQDSNAGGSTTPSSTFLRQLLSNSAAGTVVPISGVTVGRDDKRIAAVLERIVVGLFWRENEIYLPFDYEVEVIGRYDTKYSNWPVQQSVRRLLSDEEPVNIGDGVFQYWWSWDEQAPPGEAHQSEWLLRFYEGTSFLCRIARPQENVSPSPQGSFALPGYLGS